MQTVDLGEVVPIITTWWDADSLPAEPSAISLTIIDPAGTAVAHTKAEMTGSVSDGATLDVWTYLLAITADGVWRYIAVGTVDGAPVTERTGILIAGAASRAPGPCEQWAEWSDVERLCPTIDMSSLTPADREYILDIATWVLYSLDGRRYPGICTTTINICRSCSTCGVGSDCCCGVRDSIDLGWHWPVLGVWDVTIDGVLLAPTAYRVRNQRWLDRIDDDYWPTFADLTDPTAFSVSMAFGQRPPIGLQNAAAVFAAESAKACLQLECQLPQRVTSVSREGVSYTILDSQRFLDDGRTGIYTVDLALSAAKVGRTAPRAGAFSPLASTRTARY